MRPIKALRLGLAFLTIIPIRFRDGEATDADLAASRFAYPPVGLLIGLLLAGLSEGLAWRHAGPQISAFLLILFAVAFNGGLHLDGLADTADGLFLAGGPERRLAVMRDPHVGSFGVVALVLALLGKFAALATLAEYSRSLALIGSSVASRSAILIAAGLAGYARPEGTGRIVIESTTRRDALIAAIIMFMASYVANGAIGLAAGLIAVGLAMGLARLSARRLGGVTGDILGAVVELADLGYLLTLGLVIT